MPPFIQDMMATVITLAAVITALGFLFKKSRGWMLNYLGIETTPSDVKDLLEEVHYGVSFLVAWVIKGENQDDLDPEVLEAMTVLQEAGYDLNFGSDNGG